MRIIENNVIETALDYRRLIQELKQIFLSNFTMPVRHHHFYQNTEEHENTLILMPSWTEEFVGVKQVIVAPNNYTKELPAGASINEVVLCAQQMK